MAKRILAVMLAAMLVIGITACGGGGGEGTSGNSSSRNSGVVPRGSSTSNPGNENPGDTNTDDTETPNPPPPDEPLLNLPLVVVNNTVVDDYFIDNGGNVRRYSSYSGAFDDIIISDVRSVENSDSYGGTQFFIKNDNSLWAMGNNNYGQLGDGTGVNKNEPVKILDNVANAYSVKESIGIAYAYAITTDRKLYRWGEHNKEKIYAPEEFLDDVVSLDVAGYAIKSDGSLWTWDTNYFSPQDLYFDGKPTKIMSDVQAVQTSLYLSYSLDIYVIKGDNSLWTWNISRISENFGANIRYETTDIEKILDDVRNLEIYTNNYGHSIFIITADNVLWGRGENARGQLGDGTKINRDEPVKIMDGVADVRGGAILDLQGNVWSWGSNNPTPEIILTDIAALCGDYFLGKSRYLYDRNGNEIIGNVKLPSSVVYNGDGSVET